MWEMLGGLITAGAGWAYAEVQRRKAKAAEAAKKRAKEAAEAAFREAMERLALEAEGAAARLEAQVADRMTPNLLEQLRRVRQEAIAKGKSLAMDEFRERVQAASVPTDKRDTKPERPPPIPPGAI